MQMSLKELQIIAVNKCVKPVFPNLASLDLITHEKLLSFLIGIKVVTLKKCAATSYVTVSAAIQKAMTNKKTFTNDKKNSI